MLKRAVSLLIYFVGMYMFMSVIMGVMPDLHMFQAAFISQAVTLLIFLAIFRKELIDGYKKMSAPENRQNLLKDALVALLVIIAGFMLYYVLSALFPGMKVMINQEEIESMPTWLILWGTLIYAPIVENWSIGNP